ncbi:iron-containing alcohol dehydrogenase family protein, partial [Candidatus Aerophobetes bacterium]|nr:iron-containing alcohol dehydrogenase family protein [Candidatus Aerophobetes bacterium]
IQEKGIIDKVGEFLRNYGEYPLFLADSNVKKIIEGKIKESLDKRGIGFEFFVFGGECCREEIEKVVSFIEKCKTDLVVGCGGGKAIDTAKAAAFYTNLPFVSFPTSAATCAAWSGSCPLYTSCGEYIGTQEMSKNPELVLVDSQIIAEAPSRLLSAGMADSLAKWYEGNSTTRKGENIMSDVALTLSEELCRIIKKYGLLAKINVDRKICSREVEIIIQANILIAGIIGAVGGKNFRSAAAHAFNYALCGFTPASFTLHGERVAIGVLIQLLLEGKDRREFAELVETYRKLGIPCSMQELGVCFSEEDLKKIAFRVCQDRRMRNLPFLVDEKTFISAFLEAERLVKQSFERPCYDIRV